MDINVEYQPNAKQYIFHASASDEVVYGGAKGGGKSCALVMEALGYGLEYPEASMYIFRETYDDLEANIIREWKEKVPKQLYKYHEGKHEVTLINGTSIKFRYISSFKDAEGYQGRSMDWIGVDELTKHEERSIQVLLSCLRSPKGYPPRFRGTCNPGGIGHVWVKENFIEATEYGKNIITNAITEGTIEFIPAKVYDNTVLMDNDPNYVKRLENLPENQKKAFLYGDWDLFEGQFFGEWDRKVHVIEPFIIPKHWDRFTVTDYGLDMEATLWIAIDEQGKGYAYKESYKSDLIISEAAREILRINNKEKMVCHYAPPDLWNRRQETGKSAWDIFTENGVAFVKSDNNQENGAMSTKEWLKVREIRDEQTGKTINTSDIKFFNNCVNAIRCIPQVQTDDKNPNIYSKTPHELTHIVDALRYFCIMRTSPSAAALLLEKPSQNNFIEKPKEVYQVEYSNDYINMF